MFYLFLVFINIALLNKTILNGCDFQLIMKLHKKKCELIQGNIPPLNEGEIKEFLKQLPSWEIKDNRLSKQFDFDDFKETMNFVNKVAFIVHRENHCPDMQIHYNQVNVEIWTQSINGLSENDFILAAKIENMD